MSLAFDYFRKSEHPQEMLAVLLMLLKQGFFHIELAVENNRQKCF